MKFSKIVLGMAVLSLSSLAAAGPITGLIGGNTWDGWTVFGNDDGHVGPGGGGQGFDAEFLLYKMSADGKSLSIGLQTGFDVEDGHQTTGSREYWAGDLFLSFDDNTSSYEYAIDFGFEDGTCGYYQGGGSAVCGKDDLHGLNDPAGLYSVSDVNNEIYFKDSGPFAMQEGALIGAIEDNVGDQVGDTFFRTATFDIADLGSDSQFSTFDASWTMSCGNDVITGHADVPSVPEPPVVGLLALGLISLGFVRRRA